MSLAVPSLWKPVQGYERRALARHHVMHSDAVYFGRVMADIENGHVIRTGNRNDPVSQLFLASGSRRRHSGVCFGHQRIR